MYKNLIFKIFSLPRIYKIISISIFDLLIIVFSTYVSLAIRLDEMNLFNISDKYLISVEFFLIPIIIYFIFAAFFKFYSLSFRYYNLGQDIYYIFPLFGISIIFFNILFNKYFSYGALLINIILILVLIVISRKLISKIYFVFQKKSKINSIVVCSSRNIHKIYEFLNLNEKIAIKSIILDDSEKIDFTRYRNYKINKIKDLREICKKQNIKAIYTDKYIQNLKKNYNKKISINVLQVDNLFKNFDINNKRDFVDKYFSSYEKIKNKSLNIYNNKIILITGAGGSIGKNLFFELIGSKPKKIILVEQDELKLFNLKKEYENKQIKNVEQFDVLFKLGNLSNDLFLNNIFLEDKKIDYVLHAAAYKHVGFGEENVLSFVKNNIFVTYNLAKVSIKNKVKKFIFISTDKAVNPKSVMGYSKSFCEKLLIDLNNKHNLKNVFKIVRFGNVINSDGSVLPIFEKQILKGGPLTITDKNVSRYFMSIKNACQLVLNTIEIDKKIGIFILDMGKSYKILHIAKSMINFYLQRRIINIKPKIIFIGLQKGEKIKEELILGKNLEKTKIKNILFANEKVQNSADYSLVLAKLKNFYEKNKIKNILNYLKNYA